MQLKDNYLVKKRNILNELRSNNMSLQELRFFSIYLSKINPEDTNTRLVRFPLEDFRKIMELSQIKINYLKGVVDSLLGKTVKVPTERGGLLAFQLFKTCLIDIDDNGEWFIEIDAHDNALPLMFDFKERYFSYRLWNALRLKSSNQLRMYELLKQYEKIGERIIAVDTLKELMGINESEYKRFGDLKSDVLEVCKKALEESTDIRFTYEPTGKKGRGGKILTLKFKIYKNKNYKDPLTLDDFIYKAGDFIDGEAEEKIDHNPIVEESIKFMSEACNNEFSFDEIKVLCDLVIKIIPSTSSEPTARYDYLHRQYNDFCLQAKKRIIKNRFAYFKKIIKADFDDIYEY